MDYYCIKDLSFEKERNMQEIVLMKHIKFLLGDIENKINLLDNGKELILPTLDQLLLDKNNCVMDAIGKRAYEKNSIDKCKNAEKYNDNIINMYDAIKKGLSMLFGIRRSIPLSEKFIEKVKNKICKHDNVVQQILLVILTEDDHKWM